VKPCAYLGFGTVVTNFDNSGIFSVAFKSFD
jgi:hypothetical protein